MPNPLTHLLFGYAVTKNITDKKKLIVFGLISSVLLDIDGLPIPGISHHGFIHTPFFIGIVCLSFFVFTRSRLILKISFFNMLIHIFIDTIATTIPVMWSYPFSTYSFAVGEFVSIPLLYAIKLILLIIPAAYIFKKYLDKEQNPIDLFNYIKESIGEISTYSLIIGFSVLTIYIWITDYLLEVI